MDAVRRRPLLAGALVALLLAVSALTACELPNPDAARSPLGMNLAGIADWSTEVPFADVFRQSRDWISGNVNGGPWDDGRPIATDADGWVTSLQADQLVRTILWTDVLPGTMPAGDYVVTFDGAGTLAFSGASVVSSQAGRRVVRVPSGSTSLIMEIRATTAGNPIRNIHAYLPGGVCGRTDDGVTTIDQFRRVTGSAGCTSPMTYLPFEQLVPTHVPVAFNPDFLARFRDFKVLRFMDWGDTNNSAQRNWSDRPKLSHARWRHGVPIEAMVALANSLDAEPWFTLPHLATDDYVMQFATVVRDELQAGLLVHVEYSNEVWNTGFSQACYAIQQGIAAGYGTGSGGSCGDWIAGSRWYAHRATAVHDLSESVLGDARVDRVLASQLVFNYRTEVIEAEPVAGATQAGRLAETLAVANYFGDVPTGQDQITLSRPLDGRTQLTCGSTTVPNRDLQLDDPATTADDATFRAQAEDPTKVAAHIALLRQYSVPYTTCFTAVNRALAQGIDTTSWGGPALDPQIRLGLMAYEGGQHLVGVYGTAWTPDHAAVNYRYDAINRSPLMHDLYADWLAGWKAESGGGVAVAFSSVGAYSKWGRWGALEHLYQDPAAAPKWRALQEFIAANPT